jgi:NADH-quinone oxidoreductase subunit H
MGLNTIVQKQSIWFVVYSPLAALILFITAIAELGRAPFDLNEAESEIVAGFHIEYTGMKFGLFYASELLHALTFGGIIASLFLGGWRGPGAEAFPILGIFYFFIKAFFLYWAIMWIKYSLPRLRIDQMMDFNWKFLTPLAIVVLIVTAILAKILPQDQPLVFALGLLAANLVVAWVTLQILRSRAHLERERVRVAEPGPIATPERGRLRVPASIPSPETPPPAAPSATS